MREFIEKLKVDGASRRKQRDLIWRMLLASAATHGNSRGYEGLFGNKRLLKSVEYASLARLGRKKREARILEALQEAKVRMPTIKAPRLAANVDLIKDEGGVEQVTQKMLKLPTYESKFEFICQFHGIGEKYGRDVWMDIYDPSFRDRVAVDWRLMKVARALGFVGRGYQKYEEFFVRIASDADLKPWELDRLLYNFTDHFLDAIGMKSDGDDCKC